MSRQFADQVGDFIPNFPGDDVLTALDLVAAQLQLSRPAGHRNDQAGTAGAGVQVAGLASNGFEHKSGALQFLADMSRNLQFADVECG